MSNNKVSNFTEFIKANFDTYQNQGNITLMWIEDTDVSDNMTPAFKKKILKILAPPDKEVKENK